MLAEWKERNARHLVEVLVYPRANIKPFVFLYRDSDGWLMLTPMILISDPELQLLDSSHIRTEHCILRCFHREREHIHIVWSHNTIFNWNTSINHHLCERVFFICSYSSYIVRIMPSVNARSGISKLANSTRGLNASNCSRLRDSNFQRELLVGFNCNSSKFFKSSGKSSCFSVGEVIVHDSCH